MTTVQHISELATAVMPSVLADIAALYPAASPVQWAVSSRESNRYGSPPRVVWVPSRDGFEGAQKRTFGGQNGQHSIATRVAGVRIELWGETIEQTEDLLESVVRALLKGGGPARVGVTILSGQWIEAPGENALGEGYALSLTLPIDVRASCSADTRVAITGQLGTLSITP